MGNAAAIIVAAGTGTRMGTLTVPKQFLLIDGVPILAYTLRKFESCPAIDSIVLVTRREDRTRCENLVAENGVEKIAAIVEGGKERQDSVFQGLLRVSPQTGVVLIHDAVRMFVSEEILVTSIQDAQKYGATVTAVPVKDTIKKVATSHDRREFTGENTVFVAETLERKVLWHSQTPQTFRYNLILEFHKKARELGIHGTDDAMLAEYFGHPVKIVYGSYRNMKITTPDDLLIAEAFLRNER